LDRKAEPIDAEFVVITPPDVPAKEPTDWWLMAHMILTVVLTMAFMHFVAAPPVHMFTDWLMYDVMGGTPPT
jgi:hypothetical protein